MNTRAIVRWPADHPETVISLPLHTVSESNSRGHWARKARRTRDHRNVVGLSCAAPLCMAREGLAADMAPGLVVTLTRVAPRELDDDNLRGCLKAVRDGVADALGVNDRDKRVRWAYEQERGKVREYGVIIVVRSGATP